MLRRLIDRALRSPRLRGVFYYVSVTPLVGPAVRALVRRLLPRGSYRWVTVPAGLTKGMVMQVDPRAEQGYLRGDHEPWLQQLLTEWLRAGDTYYDVGGHVGFFAMCAARVVGPSGQVVTFEPDPANFARLAEHVRRNALAHVEPVNAAVWSEAGTVRFHSSGERDAGVQGAVVRDASAAGGELEVRAVRLDDYAGTRVPAAVKIDVEGGEAEALLGAARIIAAGRTRWVVELHGDEPKRRVVDIFDRAGYEVQLTQPRHEVYRDYAQEYAIATPRAPLQPPAS
jgi:FkbM family methyltransferase